MTASQTYTQMHIIKIYINYNYDEPEYVVKNSSCLNTAFSMGPHRILQELNCNIL